MQSYNKTEWIPEQTLVSASNLNKLESQVELITNTVNLVEVDLTSLSESIETKVSKVEGKGLTSNDFTNEDKIKLDGLTNYQHPEHHEASIVRFTNGKNFEEMLADGSLRGPQGLKGDTGARGSNGSTGATGPKGDKGDTGSFNENAIFNSLNTDNKTVIGAINELLQKITPLLPKKYTVDHKNVHSGKYTLLNSCNVSGYTQKSSKVIQMNYGKSADNAVTLNLPTDIKPGSYTLTAYTPNTVTPPILSYWLYDGVSISSSSSFNQSRSISADSIIEEDESTFCTKVPVTIQSGDKYITIKGNNALNMDLFLNLDCIILEEMV